MVESDRIWYLRRKDSQGSIGPFGTEQLLEQWQKGELDDATAGWREGMLDWLPLAEIEPFASAVRVPKDAPGIVRFHCPCGNEIVMSEKFIGRAAKCKACGRTMVVPDPLQPDEATLRKQRGERRRRAWIKAGAVFVGLALVGAAVGQYFGLWQAVFPSSVEFPTEDDRDADPGDSTELAVRQPTATEVDDAAPAAQPRPGTDKARRDRLADALRDASGEPAQEPDRDDRGPKTTSDIPTTQESDQAQVEESAPAEKPDAERPAATITTRAEERTVRQLAQEFMDAFRVPNPTPSERLEELLSEDCIMALATGELLQGKPVCMQACTRAIERSENEFSRLQVVYNIRSCRVFADGAILFGERVEEGQPKPRGSLSKESFLQTIVLTKNAGTWQVMEVHLTAVPRRTGGAG